MTKLLIKIFILYIIAVIVIFCLMGMAIDYMIYEQMGNCDICLFLDLGSENLDLPYPDVITDEELYDVATGAAK